MLAVPGWHTLARSSGTVHSLSRSRYRAGSRSHDHSGRGGGDRSLSRSQYRSGSRSRDRSRRGAGRRARCAGRGGGGWAAAQPRPAMRTGASEKGSRPQDEARPFWGSPLSRSGPRAEGSCTPAAIRGAPAHAPLAGSSRPPLRREARTASIPLAAGCGAAHAGATGYPRWPSRMRAAKGPVRAGAPASRERPPRGVRACVETPGLSTPCGRLGRAACTRGRRVRRVGGSAGKKSAGR